MSDMNMFPNDGVLIAAKIEAQSLQNKSEIELRNEGFVSMDTKYFVPCPRCGKMPNALGHFPQSAVVYCCGLETIVVSADTEKEPINEMSAALAWGDLAYAEKKGNKIEDGHSPNWSEK